MTYADELDHLTRAVAALVEEPEQPLDDIGVQTALSSRKALLGLLTVQMAEAAPLDRSITTPDILRLAEHPVAAFIGTLREYPRPHGEIAPSILYSQLQETPAGALWLEIGRRSTLAQAEWQGAGKPLTDEQAWTVVGDAAALASVLTRLDEDLSAAAVNTGCDDLVQALAQPAPARLAIAANEVKHLAGPRTEAVTLDRWRTPEARIHSVARDSDVPRALEALSALLRQAQVLKPEHIQQIALCLARVELRLNHGATTGLAKDLTEVARTPRRVACPFHGDRRPLLQAAELNRWANTHAMPPAAVRAEAEKPLHDGVRGLHCVARRQLAVGNWLVPNANPEVRHAWRLWNHSVGMPEILLALEITSLNRAAPALKADSNRTGLVAAKMHGSWSRHARGRPASPQLRPTR